MRALLGCYVSSISLKFCWWTCHLAAFVGVILGTLGYFYDERIRRCQGFVGMTRWREVM